MYAANLYSYHIQLDDDDNDDGTILSFMFGSQEFSCIVFNV